MAAPRRNAAAVMLAGSLKAGLDWVVFSCSFPPFLSVFPSRRLYWLFSKSGHAYVAVELAIAARRRRPSPRRAAAAVRRRGHGRRPNGGHTSCRAIQFTLVYYSGSGSMCHSLSFATEVAKFMQEQSKSATAKIHQEDPITNHVISIS